MIQSRPYGDEQAMRQTAIVVHGGAGAWQREPERLAGGVEACISAAAAGQRVLRRGGTALDAVEAAVRILEDSPGLDAGRGSYQNAQGDIEMDALIMDGKALEMGAVAAVQRVRHPISLARQVLAHPEHNFLVGAGAERFADSVGFARCEVADLLVDFANAEADAGPTGDTVGAVAIDAACDVAAATSTGGTRGKLPGRVGDSPLVGSGGYADNRTAAVSATGRGEWLMRLVISKQVCDYVATGLSAQTACEAAIRLLAERLEGTGGLIGVDYAGRVGIAYNTFAMPHAYGLGNGAIIGGK